MSEIKYVLTIAEGRSFTGIGGMVKRLVHPTTCGSDKLGLSIAYLHPGEEFREHSHPWEEAYFFIQGKAFVTIEGCNEELIGEPGMIMYIPADKKHYTKNIGNEPVVILCPVSPAPTTIL